MNAFPPTHRRGERATPRRGFTLVELMIVIVILGILTSVGFGQFQRFVIEGRARVAMPVLNDIAAQQRAYKNRTGQYHATLNEDQLESILGVNLAEVGDFCFITICDSDATDTDGASICGGDYVNAAPPFLSSTANTPEFEVWAILRRETTNGIDTITVEADLATALDCDPATDKQGATGWVNADASTDPGNEGQAVVLRYPPETDGLDLNNRDWTQGVTTSNVFE